MPYTAKSRLERAQKLVKLSERLVAEQRVIVAGMKAEKLSTYAAEKLLKEFESALERAIKQRDISALTASSA